MKVLSTPYWIPKMHESPVGTMFIIVRKQSVNKPLSKNIMTAFDLLSKSVEKYHNRSKFNSGCHSLCVIQNNKPVIDTL